MYIRNKIVFWSDFLEACAWCFSPPTGRTQNSQREEKGFIGKERNSFQLPVCQTPAGRLQQQTDHKYVKQHEGALVKIHGYNKSEGVDERRCSGRRDHVHIRYISRVWLKRCGF